MLENVLIRYGEPSKYDHAPYGTMCKSIKMAHEKFEIYVQISEDDSTPFWEKVGTFSEQKNHTIKDEVERVLNGRKMYSI